MNAVGIDVSKGKSTVSVLRPFGEVVASPFDVTHNDSDLNQLVELIKGLPGESKVVGQHLKFVVLKATLYNYHLTALRTSNLPISRHIAQKLLEIHKYSCVVSIQSDKEFSTLFAHNSCAVLPYLYSIQ